MREFTEKVIMPVRRSFDDDHDHVLVKEILQGLVKTDFLGSYHADVGRFSAGNLEHGRRPWL
jgi:hypothetical protein